MRACGEGRGSYLQYALPPPLALCTCMYTSGKNFCRKGCMEVTPPVMPLSNLRMHGVFSGRPWATAGQVPGIRKGRQLQGDVEASMRTQRGARPSTRLCMSVPHACVKGAQDKTSKSHPSVSLKEHAPRVSGTDTSMG